MPSVNCNSMSEVLLDGYHHHVGALRNQIGPSPQPVLHSWVDALHGQQGDVHRRQQEAILERPAPDDDYAPVSARPATAPVRPTSIVANFSNTFWWFSSLGTRPLTRLMPACRSLSANPGHSISFSAQDRTGLVLGVGC